MSKAEAFAQNVNGILARVLVPALALILAGVMFLSLVERPKTARPAGTPDARTAAPGPAPASTEAALHPRTSTPLPYFRRCQNTSHAPCR